VNIFILDQDMQKNVKSYVNKHVVKMCLESCQMLSNAYYITGQEELAPYLINHPYHRCSKWVTESLSNWFWMQELGLEICKEYTYRYGKQHKCEQIMKDMIIPNLKDIGLTEHVIDVEDLIKAGYTAPSDVVEAYRSYYNVCKQHLFNWKNRTVPEWIIKAI
jgi:hypothetical protein